MAAFCLNFSNPFTSEMCKSIYERKKMLFTEKGMDITDSLKQF